MKKRFDRWVTEYHQALFKHAFWMTGHRDTSTEIVQETYFQAWLSIDSLQDEEKVFSWLLTILRRAVYKEQRASYRQVETLVYLQNQATEIHPDNAYSHVLIYEMLNNISVQHREVFLMYYLHGLKYEDISDYLDIPVGTVMSRLSRARKSLQALDSGGSEKVVKLVRNQRDVHYETEK